MSSCQYVSTIPEKKLHVTFQKLTVCEGLYVENDGPMDQYRENGARNTYSNYNQMRAYVECSPNQSKKLYLINLAIEPSTKFLRFGKVLAVSVFEFDQSTAVQLHQPTLIRWLSLLNVYE